MNTVGGQRLHGCALHMFVLNRWLRMWESLCLQRCRCHFISPTPASPPPPSLSFPPHPASMSESNLNLFTEPYKKGTSTTLLLTCNTSSPLSSV